MIFDWKVFIKSVIIISICIFGVVSIQRYINNQSILKQQEMIEKMIEKEATIKNQCLNERVTIEENYKKEIADLKERLEKAKLLIERINKEKKYTSMIKNDINSFIKEIDSTLGVKGKINVKK